jgi:hypothetical protein
MRVIENGVEVDELMASDREYECPVCGVGDVYRYLTCNHPMCPDGRDHDHEGYGGYPLRLSDGTDISQMTVEQIKTHQRKLSPKFPTLEEARKRQLGRRKTAVARMLPVVMLVPFLVSLFHGDEVWAAIFFGGFVLACLAMAERNAYVRRKNQQRRP